MESILLMYILNKKYLYINIVTYSIKFSLNNDFMNSICIKFDNLEIIRMKIEVKCL